MKQLAFLILFLPTMLFGQLNDERRAVDARIYPQGDVQAYDLRTRTQIKRYFLFNDWREGKFIFVDGIPTKRTFPLKYDVLNQELVVDMAGSEYVVPMDSIYGFVLDDYFKQVSGSEGLIFQIRRGGKDGKKRTIYERVLDGKFRLYVGHYAEKMKPNYNAALDTGSLDEKIVKKEKFYLYDNGRMKEIPKKRKSAEKFFAAYPAAKKYLAKHRVNFKNKKSLSDLVLFMNNYQKK